MKYNVEPFIPFFQHETRNLLSHKFKDPPLHSIAQVDEKSFKRVLVDGGSTIRMFSSIALRKLNFPLSHLKGPTLILQAFNNQLCNTLGSIILPILVGLKTIHACF